MAQIKGVIFDWAGTTIDFGCMAPVQAFIDTFAKWDLSITTTETRLPMGMAKRDHIETILNMSRVNELFKQRYERDFNQDDIDQMYHYFEEILLQTLCNYVSPKPYILETISMLKNRGIRIGSSTGYNKKMMEIITKSSKNLGYEPDYWCCSDHVGGFGRPYPYMIFNNIQALALENINQIIKVGDTEVDITEGKAAGLRTVGVIDGSSELGFSEEEWETLTALEKDQQRQRCQAAFKAYGADFIIQDMRELERVIELIEKS